MTGERVYSVLDYYDGIICGVADFEGAPHHFAAEFDDARDEYSNTFVLTPITARTLEGVLELDAIFHDWRSRFGRGEAGEEPHPGSEGGNARFQELQLELERAVAECTRRRVRARGVFVLLGERSEQEKGVVREHSVTWKPC